MIQHKNTLKLQGLSINRYKAQIEKMKKKCQNMQQEYEELFQVNKD